MKSLGLSTEQNFLFSEYKDKSGKKNKTYLMNRDGILQIAASESVYVRAKIIEYINALETKIVEQQFKLPTTYKEALQQLLQQVEENEKLLNVIEEQVMIQALEEVLRGAKKIDIPNYRFSRVPGYREQVYELCYNKSKSNKKEDSPPSLFFYILYSLIC